MTLGQDSRDGQSQVGAGESWWWRLCSLECPTPELTGTSSTYFKPPNLTKEKNSALCVPYTEGLKEGFGREPVGLYPLPLLTAVGLVLGEPTASALLVG